ncbi:MULTISPECIES: sensor histidine kinase [unclassified Paenibacillus]|uniref:sensor histidine kinase n=1 Tax=unclassified Paenibacillus TaxID=185978 RepID=UPI0027894753|nr:MULTISPECIES: sensor histidine kinase [unclassified Paenibacillus]MDQ0901875.1 two-component system sensor histidine kinase YesM [Paenibacillus sp. V4I7]MDQ0919627.1 two-component system sensor histidine kinase YesM [Paenibacillus sp. V4I5]
MLQTLIKKTNNIRIKNKIILAFILVGIIPVLIVSVYLTREFRQTVLNDAIGQTSNNVEKISNRASDILRVPIEISNKLVINQRLERIVNTEYHSVYDVVSAYKDFSDFDDFTKLYKEVTNIRFYTTNPTTLNNWNFIQPTDTIIQSFWYQEAMNKKMDRNSWYAIEDETKNNVTYLSLVRKIYFPNYRSSGVLVVNVNPGELQSIVSKELFDTMIFDSRGSIVAAKNTDWVGKNVSELDFAKDFLNKPEGTYQTRFNGQDSKMLIQDLIPALSDSGLRIVSVFTVASIVGKANQISYMGLSITLISLVIVFVLIFFLSKMLTSRMLHLNRQINKVALGDLNATSEIDGQDEIGMLSRQFNNMVRSINELMDEVHHSNRVNNQLELRQKEIKLKMMASQINPHFLFNALESIRMKAHLKGETEISGIVRTLGKLMRKKLEIMGSLIPLKDELEMVRGYLDIQKFRFGDRLNYEIHMAPEASMIKITPLIIQPIVENAVVHGLESIENNGVVRIYASVREAHLQIEVTDNGMGMSSQRLLEIEQTMQDTEDKEEHRIGMRNVHQRLNLMYGEAYGLSINTNEGKGTRITFSIPIKE